MQSTPLLLHVLGAGPWQLATMRMAREMGCRVLATDGSADKAGFALADLQEVADITDPAATLAAARRHRVDGVLCDTTDNGVLAAAFTAAELGLPGIGPEAARNCTDKARMTACAAAAGLRVPLSAQAADVQAAQRAALALPGPWVVKPVDNQSGRGVAVVRDAAALPTALAEAFRHSRRHEVLVQEFVAGVEVIVDSLVCDNELHVLGVAAKLPYADNPTVSQRITYGVAALPVTMDALTEANAQLLRALGVKQGLVHAEFMLDGGAPVPIDVAARGGGVHIYPVVLPHVSGVDAMRAAIELALGRPCHVQPRPARRAANIEFLRAGSGRIAAIRGVQAARDLPGVAVVHLNLGPGDDIGHLQHKDHRLGHIVTLANTVEEAVDAGQRAARLVHAEMQ